MKRPCLFVRRRHWFALLLVPFLAWGIVLAVVPTGWARARLVDRLSKTTGRSVKIGALRLGVFGDLRIIDLAIAEPNSPSDPWLKVGEAKIDVHLGQVLTGHCDPKEIEVDSVVLRIWRRKDGTNEIGDLLTDRSTSSRGGPSWSASVEVPRSIAIKVSGANVRVIDDSSGNCIEFADVKAKGAWGGRLVSIEKMSGVVNGGTFAMAAKLDRDPRGPRFEAEVRAVDVEIGREMPVLGFFVPVVAGATDGLGGKFDLLLALKGQGATRSEIRRSLRGHGSVALDPIDMEGSKFLAQLDVLGDWPKESKIGSVTTDFLVERGRITTDELTIRASRFPFVLGGWTDFDGRFDYVAKVDRITAKLPKEAKGWISELKVNFDQLAGLRMKGSIDQIEVTVHGHPLTGDPDLPDDERARFRDTARRIRDRFFR
jgi:AsmA-like C-terminal region